MTEATRWRFEHGERVAFVNRLGSTERGVVVGREIVRSGDPLRRAPGRVLHVRLDDGWTVQVAERHAWFAPAVDNDIGPPQGQGET